MRRAIFLILTAAWLTSCVSVEPAIDPRGAVPQGQRLIVMVFQSPGPWIIANADSKAETAIKILPLGTFLQGIQDEKINELSKEIQPYLPRPRYDRAVEQALISGLKAAHDGPVQTAGEAGILALQTKEWNEAADQLEWRKRYYFVDSTGRAPRDYSKLLSLDDAEILDVNISFGLEPDENERTLPALTATARLYRAGTTRLLWSREVRALDSTSSSTLSEFRVAPAELTDRLFALSQTLANDILERFKKDVGLFAPPPPPAPVAPAPLEQLPNTAPPATTTPASVSTPTAAPPKPPPGP